MDTKTNCYKKTDVTPKFVPISYGAVTGSVLTSFTAKAQEDVYLKFAMFTASTNGVVRDFKIGNQSLNCSDSSIELQAFNPPSQRRPFVGVAVNGNIQISVDLLLDGAGAEQFQGALSCEAIDKAPTLAEQGQALNRFFGLGSVSVPAAGTAQLNAQALRDCMLKDLVLAAHGAGDDVVITDITVKGRSLFSGQSGAAISLSALQNDVQGGFITLNLPIETNERVIVTLSNAGASAIVVGGAIYAE